MASQDTKKVSLNFAVVSTPNSPDCEPWGNGTLPSVVEAYLGDLKEQEAHRLVGQTVTFGPFKVRFTGIK